MTDEGLWAASIFDVAGPIQRGDLSPIALTEAMLDRIARLDGRLHSFVAVTAALARAGASRAAAEIRAGHWRGPLHGIPIALKDIFYTPGIPASFGSPVYQGWEPPHEATVARRLTEAGAVLLGKLALTEGVYADHHPTVTPPVNPFGAAHWTGTSSSGSGVAVTAGLCFGTLGSDTGGSIRLPSACCGVVGIKPTWGRVSRHGVFALAESLDHVGPMARTVADAALLLRTIAGADGLDPTAAPVAVPDYLAWLNDGIAGLRVGIDWTVIRARAEDAVVATMESVAASVVAMGVRLSHVRLPPLDDVLLAWSTQCSVEAAVAHRETFPARACDYGPRLAKLLRDGAATSGPALAEAQAVRRCFTGQMARLFDDIDLLLIPALPVAGPSLEYMASLGEDPEGILAIGPFTAPFDMCGYPTITLPCGVSDRGIPVGVQFAAKPFAEDLLIRAGHAYQSRTDWHRRRPEFGDMP
jgi:amidase